MIAILFVCTANICRSPMAEGLLKKIVSERADADEWHIESAGAWAYEGNPAAVLSATVMEKKGIDISAHRSKPTSLELLNNFDLVLTMEDEHKKFLTYKYGECANRIYRISEMVGDMFDVPDPIGGGLADYEQIAYLLENILTAGVDKIYELALIPPQEL